MRVKVIAITESFVCFTRSLTMALLSLQPLSCCSQPSWVPSVFLKDSFSKIRTRDLIVKRPAQRKRAVTFYFRWIRQRAGSRCRSRRCAAAFSFEEPLDASSFHFLGSPMSFHSRLDVSVLFVCWRWNAGLTGSFRFVFIVLRRSYKVSEIAFEHWDWKLLKTLN